MLEADHTSEVTVTAYQIVRRSLLGYTTILKEHNVIGIANRTHTMSNDKDGLIPRQLRDTQLDLRFILCIKARRCLVKKDNGSVLKERPCDGETLPLPAGECFAILPYDRVVPLRHPADEVLTLSQPCDTLHFLIGGVRLPYADIVCYGGVEKNYVLKDDRKVPQQSLGVYPGNVLTLSLIHI